MGGADRPEVIQPGVCKRTGTTPERNMSRHLAASSDTSMIRPVQSAGPRSVISTSHEWLLVRLVTMTLVPNGRVRCAAVMRDPFSGTPLLVILPLRLPP